MPVPGDETECEQQMFTKSPAELRNTGLTPEVMGSRWCVIITGVHAQIVDVVGGGRTLAAE